MAEGSYDDLVSNFETGGVFLINIFLTIYKVTPGLNGEKNVKLAMW